MARWIAIAFSEVAILLKNSPPEPKRRFAGVHFLYVASASALATSHRHSPRRTGGRPRWRKAIPLVADAVCVMGIDRCDESRAHTVADEEGTVVESGFPALRGLNMDRVLRACRNLESNHAAVNRQIPENAPEQFTAFIKVEIEKWRK
jgi:hypothetical protein